MCYANKIRAKVHYGPEHEKSIENRTKTGLAVFKFKRLTSNFELLQLKAYLPEFSGIGRGFDTKILACFYGLKHHVFEKSAF